ncbi:MAG: hypothetical protein MUE40_11920 [Anaerolineae bacterium]|nr:hypothetical protein [Anaerolineae bacterium]
MNLRRALLMGLTAGLLLAGSLLPAAAQPGIENTSCTRADNSVVYANYNYRDDALTLRDPRTGALLFVVEAFATDYINLKAWSPDCRYLFGQAGQAYALWDTVTGGRLATITDIPFILAPEIAWDDDDYITISHGLGPMPEPVFYVYNVPGRRTLALTVPDQVCRLRNLVWDEEHQEVWGRSQCVADLTGEVQGYRLTDGSLIGRYPSLLEQTDVEGAYQITFDVREERQFVLVAPFRSEYVMIYRRDGTLLANLHTFHTYLPRHAISPDGRYYVIAQNQLRVWDLTALAADTSQPAFTWAGPDRVMQSVRFIDAQTVETTTTAGTQRWNILTGALLP